MTFKDYLDSPELSRSDVVNLLDSFATYEYNKANPIKTTPAMLKGRIIHEYLFTPDLFLENTIVAKIPENKDATPKRTTPEFKLTKDANPDKEIITSSQYQVYQDMKKQLQGNKAINEFLYHKKNEYEVTNLFTANLNKSNFDPELVSKLENTVVQCKCRYDVINHSEQYIIDYKTTSEDISSEWQIESIIRRWKYYLQDSFYSVGARRKYNKLYKFFFVLQKTTPPYLCQMVQIDNDYSKFGIRKVLEGFYKYLFHMQNPKEYKGYFDGIYTINKPEFLT